jgi:hypothetical protein
MFRDELSRFIEEQLREMARNVVSKSEKNIANRTYNPFSLFEGDEEKYMAVGRSLDSQLGTRLQKIAFYCARYTYGFGNVPNVVAMNENKEGLVVELLSYPIEKGMNQCLYWGREVEECLSDSCRRDFKSFPKKFDYQSHVFKDIDIDGIRNIIDGQGGKMPMDLFFLDSAGNAHAYEIKAGGNLDTKNKVENKNEIMRLKNVFSMFRENNSKFATCYNNKGEGNTPDGAIFSMLNEDQKAIGRFFWEEILPLEEVSYEDFIELYSEAFKNARVREIIANGN